MTEVYNWTYLVLAEVTWVSSRAVGRHAVAGNSCSIYGSQGPILPHLPSNGKDFMQEISCESVAKPQQYGQHEQPE